MSNRRMFSNRIANSARFLQMPTESQLLYFHFIIRADDDGVVESYPIMRLLNVGADSYKVLLAKGFVRELNDDQVVVIVDWLEHNSIRPDRKVDSIYKYLLIENNIETVSPRPRIDVKDNSRRLGGQSTDGISKVKLSKVKLSKVKLSKDKLIESADAPTHASINSINGETIKEIADRYGVDTKFVSECWDTAKNWLMAKGKRQKDYKAFLANWVKREKASMSLRGSTRKVIHLDLNEVGKE